MQKKYEKRTWVPQGKSPGVAERKIRKLWTLFDLRLESNLLVVAISLQVF